MTGRRDQREYFRLYLPPGEELSVRIEGHVYKVDEISEQSVRIVLGANQYLPHFKRASIRWSDHRISYFSGELGPFRSRSRRLIVNIRGIGMNDIIKEQRRLLAKYPLLRERGARR